MTEEQNNKGRAFLLKFAASEDYPFSYQTAAGLRINSELIDEGIVTIAATGIFLGSAAEAKARGIALSGEAAECELSFDNGRKLRGQFRIQRLDYVGDFNGERKFLVHIKSADRVAETIRSLTRKEEHHG